MSMSGISFLTEQQQDIRSPEFAKVLKGFDPMEVEAYVYQVVQHIEALEKEIERLQSQRDAAEDHYNSVVEDAYQQVAGRMGEVIRAADHYVEKLRVDSEADAKRRVAEASRQAEGIRKDAENDAAQIRAEAQADAERMREDGPRWTGSSEASSFAATRCLASSPTSARRSWTSSGASTWPPPRRSPGAGCPSPPWRVHRPRRSRRTQRRPRAGPPRLLGRRSRR